MFKKGLTALIIGSLFSSFMSAQELKVRIDQIVSKNYPKMEVFISVHSRDGEPIMSLVPGNFKVMVDGKEISGKVKVEGQQFSQQPIAYAVLISSNGLMEGEPLNMQQKATINLMESLKDQDRLSVFLYGDEQVALFENEKKNENLAKKISDIQLLGYSPKLFDALMYTARKLNDSPLKRKVLIIISDGRDVESKYTRDQVYTTINEMNFPVYGIGLQVFGRDNLSNIFRVADNTGGGYKAAEPVGLTRAVKQINSQITQGYILNFNVSHVPGDDQVHQLVVNVNNEGEKDSSSRNFKAVKTPFPLWLKIVIIVSIVVLLIILIVLLIIIRNGQRKQIGITKRKCPVCKRRMKDDWDECQFCKYLPPKKKNKEA